MVLIDIFLMLRGEVSDLYKYIIGYKNRKAFDGYKKKKLFFLMTPSYGNLGDQAIEVATTRCLEKHFQEYSIVKIHLQDTSRYLKAVKRSIGKDDVIVLQGGGNFGDLYPSCERARRRIVKAIKHNYIISMPSSIHYLSTLRGRIELVRSSRIYNNRKNFICISRDRFSYDFAKEHFFGCYNLLSPDIVLYLQEKNIERNRDAILLCIRTDKESAIGNEREHLVNILFRKYDNAIITDTQLYRGVSDENKINEVESILRIFRSAKVVVTDRLHGLVFSVITNTPCVVIESKDKKIEGVYEWVKNNPSIVFCPATQLNTIEECVNELLSRSMNYEYNLTEQIDDVMHQIVGMIKMKEEI